MNRPSCSLPVTIVGIQSVPAALKSLLAYLPAASAARERLTNSRSFMNTINQKTRLTLQFVRGMTVNMRCRNSVC